MQAGSPLSAAGGHRTRAPREIAAARARASLPSGASLISLRQTRIEQIGSQGISERDGIHHGGQAAGRGTRARRSQRSQSACRRRPPLPAACTSLSQKIGQVPRSAPDPDRRDFSPHDLDTSAPPVVALPPSRGGTGRSKKGSIGENTEVLAIASVPERARSTGARDGGRTGRRDADAGEVDVRIARIEPDGDRLAVQASIIIRANLYQHEPGVTGQVGLGRRVSVSGLSGIP